MIILKTASEIMEDLKINAKEQFGEDFNTSENSDWYRKEYPHALQLSLLYQKLADFQDNLDLSKANDYWFWRIASNYLFFRKMPTKSLAIVTTTDSQIGASALKGEIKLRKKGTDVIYSNNSNIIIDKLPFSFEIESETSGAITNAEIGEISEVVSAPANWGTFINTESAEGGQDLETLEEGRKRFFNNNNNSEVWNVDGITAALLNLRGVKSANVTQNSTDEVVNGVPRRSIHCVVDGGIEKEISNVIFIKSLPATYSHGSVLKNVESVNGQLIDIRFDRPSEIKIDCKVEVYGESSTEEIKNYIKEYINSIGVGKIVSRSSAQLYVQNKISNFNKYENVDILFKKEGTEIWSSYIVLKNNEKPIYADLGE